MVIQKVEQCNLPGAFLIHLGTFTDTRGFFTELFHKEELKKIGFEQQFVQDNLSQSRKFVLRGMHYQLEPFGMGKLVCCLNGEIFDVIVDLRRGSPTFGQWQGFYLSGEELKLLWVPVGFAHGFLSLRDNTYVLYKCTAFYNPDADRSLSYCCPIVNIQWPAQPQIISEKDIKAPSLDRAEYNFVYKRE